MMKVNLTSIKYVTYRIWDNYRNEQVFDMYIKPNGELQTYDNSVFIPELFSVFWDIGA